MRKSFKKRFLMLVMVGGDILLMYFSILVTLALRHRDLSVLSPERIIIHFIYFSFVFAAWFLFLVLLDFYEIPPLKDWFEFFSRLIVFLFLAFISGGFYFYFRPNITPKTILFLNVLVFGFYMFLWRFLINTFLSIINFKQKIIIIGSRPELKEISPSVLTKNKYKLITRFPAENIRETSFKKQAENIKPDFIILALIPAEKDIIQKNFSNLPLGFNYINFKDFYEELFEKVPTHSINETWFLENFRGRSKIHEHFIRLLDIALSALGLIFTVLLLPFVITSIKVSSPGPILYRQKRIGKDGKPFILYKFRTMRKDAEQSGAQWSVEGDPRQTFVGRILRASHIDEFPQFYNIIKGELSFVGPRPERPEFVEKLEQKITFYNLRHLIKPGLTGWAQIRYHYGSTVEDAREKLKYDLYYIKHRSPLFYLGIVSKTGSAVLKTAIGKVLRKLVGGQQVDLGGTTESIQGRTNLKSS